MDRVSKKRRENSPIFDSNADKESEISSKPDTPASGIQNSPAESTSEPSFFHTPFQIVRSGSENPIEVTFAPEILLLLAALVEELKTQNDINITRMKLAEQAKQQEQAANQEAEAQDQARFEELRHSLYS